MDFKIFVLAGEITWESVGMAVGQLYDADLDEDINKLIIPILSPGGDVDAAWSLYATLKNLSTEVVTVANGRVYSAALIPYLAGSKRYALPESVFLFHPATITAVHNEEKPLYKYKEEILGEKYDRLILKDVLSKLFNTRSRVIISRLIHDSKSMFVDANKAKDYGLVTEIVSKLGDIK